MLQQQMRNLQHAITTLLIKKNLHREDCSTMIENVVEFFKNLPPKQCVSCAETMEEQHECYQNECDKCNVL